MPSTLLVDHIALPHVMDHVIAPLAARAAFTETAPGADVASSAPASDGTSKRAPASVATPGLDDLFPSGNT